MIRTVRIPQGVTRMGCAPGASCCSDCAGETGPPIGPAVTHTHAIPTGRNQVLRGALGATQCDPDGNCYTDGVLTSAPLTTGQGCDPGIEECGPAINNTTTYILSGVAIIALLEFFQRKR